MRHACVTRPEVLVIGGGPAGVAAAIAALQAGANTLVLERGPELLSRRRDNPAHIVSGVGGAGLFSDGKFSFYPSASNLWNLSPSSDLRAAYEWCKDILGPHGVAAPDYPRDAQHSGTVTLGHGFARKRYPSFYMTRENRDAFALMLATRVDASLRPRVAMCSFSLNPLTVRAVDSNGSATLFIPKAVVLAIGRFGPIFLQNVLDSSNLVFRRLEVGVRIEQRASKFFLDQEASIDPKFIGHNGRAREFRTFCCCRNGEVVVVNSDGITSVSGRSDGVFTDRSNIGFLVRVSDELDPAADWPMLLGRLRATRVPASESFADAVENSQRSQLDDVLGVELASATREGLRALQYTWGTTRFVDAEVHYPAIEGVGHYPNVSQLDLRLNSLPVWVAGDASGIFRGLTAALVSGYYAGMQAARTAGSEI